MIMEKRSYKVLYVLHQIIIKPFLPTFFTFSHSVATNTLTKQGTMKTDRPQVHKYASNQKKRRKKNNSEPFLPDLFSNVNIYKSVKWA